MNDPRLASAQALLRGGRTGLAIASLRTLVGDSPDFAAGHFELARALGATGDRVAAEAAFRAALVADPAFAAAAAALAALLNGRRAGAEALAVLAPFIGDARAGADIYSAQAVALKLLGRLDEAAKAWRRAVEAAPADGVAEHNLAGVLGDAHDFAGSEAATRRAFSKGIDAPETWLVRGRALQGLGEFDEAEAAFRQALQRRPYYADAHGDLAQLIWMRTEDAAEAGAALDAALEVKPGDAPMSIAKAKLLEYVGDRAGAYEAIRVAISRDPANPELHVTAANLIVYSDATFALEHAERALSITPGSAPAETAVCQANLAVGRPEIAARIAEGLCRDWPLDQFPIALAATAWRMLGDPRYRELYNYDRVVRVRTIETPDGWSNLESFLGDLAARLRALQQLKAHPIGQSLRSGTQTGQSLALSEDPVIRAFFTALDAPIRDYITTWKSGEDGRGGRATGDYRFSGAWSALLRPGGFHTNHLHPMGWISSACHIVVPQSVEQGRQGWLTFGEPGIPTDPPLAAEHFIKPHAGDLVLFPSYMWHGTVPFSGDEPRLTTAFDVLPA